MLLQSYLRRSCQAKRQAQEEANRIATMKTLLQKASRAFQELCVSRLLNVGRHWKVQSSLPTSAGAPSPGNGYSGTPWRHEVRFFVGGFAGADSCVHRQIRMASNCDFKTAGMGATGSETAIWAFQPLKLLLLLYSATTAVFEYPGLLGADHLRLLRLCSVSRRHVAAQAPDVLL